MTYFDLEKKILSLYAKNRSWELYVLQLYKIVHRSKIQSDKMSLIKFLLEILSITTEHIKRKHMDDLVSHYSLRSKGKYKGEDKGEDKDYTKKFSGVFQKTNVKIKDLENYVYLYIGEISRGKINKSEMLDDGFQFSDDQIVVSGKLYREYKHEENKHFVLLQQAFRDFSENDMVGIDISISHLLNRIKKIKKGETVIINIKRSENFNNPYFKEYIRTLIIGLVELILEKEISFEKIFFDCESDAVSSLTNSMLDEIINILRLNIDTQSLDALILGYLDLEPFQDYFNKQSKIAPNKPAINFREKFSLNSKKMDADFRLLYRIKDTDDSILLLGESGSGKQYLVELIHKESNRNKNVFVEINCASVPKEILNSELFGHKKGAFTGATSDKEGLFKIADKGTLFLDEIGDAPIEVQLALLKFLDTKKIRKVGGTTDDTVNVRIIFATNKNLEELVKQKLFREDLYYRITQNPINIIPLREHFEDLPDLVKSIKGKWEKSSQITLHISESFIKALEKYHWPGNIRELYSVLNRIFHLAEGEQEKVIDERHFKPMSRLRSSHSTTFQLSDYEILTLEFFKNWLNIREEISTELKSQPQLNREKDDSNLLSFGRSVVEPILANIYINNRESLGLKQTEASQLIGLSWASKTGTLLERHKLYPIVEDYFG